MVSATLGVTSLTLGSFAHWASHGSIWLTWWMGDVVSSLGVAPLLRLWGRRPRLRWSRIKVVEAALFFLFVVAAGAAVLGGFVPSRGSHDALEFLALPLVVWAAFRLGQREAALATFLLMAIAILGHAQTPWSPGCRNVQ